MRQLAIHENHENHNNPTSKASLFTKKRKKYRRAVRKMEAAARGESPTTDVGR